MNNIIDQVREAVTGSKNRMATIEAIRDVLYELSPLVSQPVDRVRWVPIDRVEPNDYNPNSVASKEMGLLYHSIKQDGYTQPVVTIYDPDKDKYVIVDGFHRYFVCTVKKDIYARCEGLLPIVVLDKSINERMASTVRHNRARGEHSVTGMGKLVFEMLENGWSDVEVCNHLGLEPEELLKLKHITGFSKLFEDVEYSRAWETKRMIRLRLEYAGKHKEGQSGQEAATDEAQAIDG